MTTAPADPGQAEDAVEELAQRLAVSSGMVRPQGHHRKTARHALDVVAEMARSSPVAHPLTAALAEALRYVLDTPGLLEPVGSQKGVARCREAWSRGRSVLQDYDAQVSPGNSPVAVPRGHCDRCERCGWPLVAPWEPGCWITNCSLRPRPEPRSHCACGAPYIGTPAALPSPQPPYDCLAPDANGRLPSDPDSAIEPQPLNAAEMEWARSEVRRVDALEELPKMLEARALVGPDEDGFVDCKWCHSHVHVDDRKPLTHSYGCPVEALRDDIRDLPTPAPPPVAAKVCSTCGTTNCGALAPTGRAMEDELEAAKRVAQEAVRGYEGAMVMLHEVTQERDAARGEVERLRAVLVETEDNVDRMNCAPRVLSALQDVRNGFRSEKHLWSAILTYLRRLATPITKPTK